MTRIAVIGGTGYAGRHIAAEAATRGHQVRSFSRTGAASEVPGVEQRTGDLQDLTGLLAQLHDVDAVIVAVSPRGTMTGALRPALRALAELLPGHLPGDVRLGVVGGAGAALLAPGGPRLMDAVDLPAEARPEVEEMAGVLDDLRRLTTALDWFYVHPPLGFGAFSPGERTGKYRTGGDVLVTAADGSSSISGPDFAIAVLDEIDTPRHRRTRFTVGS